MPVGGRPARMPWKSAMKDGDGFSGESRNWPGRRGWEPKTASAGEKLDSSLQAVRIPKRTQGKCFTQSGPAALARRASLSLL